MGGGKADVPSAFSVEELMSHRGWLQRLATSLVRDRDEAADLVQETLIAATERGPDQGRPVRPWLRGIIHNVWRMRVRGGARRSQREATIESADTLSPEALMQAAQMQRMLVEELESLPEIYRSTILLRYFAGLDASEIAARQQVPSGTVRRRLKEGLERLRERLDRRQGDRESWKRALLPLLALPRVPVATSSAALVAGAVLALTAVTLGYATWRSESTSGPTTREAQKPVRPVHAVSAGDRGRGGWASACPAPGGRDVTSQRPPRLIVNEALLCRLRAALVAPTSRRGRMLEALIARLGRVGDQSQSEWSARAQGAALIYLVTGDSTSAQAAYKATLRLYDEEGPSPDRGNEIARARLGVALALTYDWAWSGFTEAQRSDLVDKLTRAAASWAATPKTALKNGPRWQLYRASAELLLRLTLDDVTGADASASALAERLDELPLTRGIAIEGGPAVAQAADVLLPAIVAAESSGHVQAAATARRRDLWRFALIDQGPWLRSTKVKGPRASEGEIASFALLAPLVPNDGLVVYTREFERVATGAPDTWSTQALVWSALLAPEETSTEAPHALAALGEREGAYLFRRRTEEGAIDVSVMGGFRTAVPMTERIRPLSLSVRAFGTLFAGGKASGLSVDGQRDDAGGAWPQALVTSPGRTLVVLDALPLFPAGQLSRARRTVLVDLDGPATAPVWVVTRDEIRATTPRRVTWRIFPEVLEVSATGGAEHGRATFTLRNGPAFVKGWVLHPRGVGLDTRGAVTVKATAAATDLWIALLVGTGAPPAATITGEGLHTVLRIDGGTRAIAFDPVDDRPMIRL